MTEKRFVLSTLIDGKEVVRRAVWATDASEVAKLDLFTDDEFAILISATGVFPISLKIVETP